jgi:hypothetical protein
MAEFYHHRVNLRKLLRSTIFVADGRRVTERGLRVERWRKYGKDRLYVSDGTGRRIGWLDVTTGVSTVEVPEQRSQFEAAIVEFSAGSADRSGTASPQPAVSEAPPASAGPALADTAVASAPWRDLALNRPGERARLIAEAELALMKGRSRIGTFIARAIDMKTDERAWRVGAGGEETVGAKLDKLREHGWHVLHAVPVGNKGSDIDHVVIGWGGVFTLNTKTHPGKRIWVSSRQVRVDGHPVPYLRNSRYEAERSARLLTAAAGFPVFVRPALVFLTGSLIPDVTIKQAPEDVIVLDRMDIPGAFKRSTRRLNEETVDAIFQVARRSTTWIP